MTPPFHKISGWNANFGWNPELVVWQNYARKKRQIWTFLLMSWMPALRVQHAKTKYRRLKCMKLCLPQKRLKSCFQLQVLSPHVATGMSQATGVECGVLVALVVKNFLPLKRAISFQTLPLMFFQLGECLTNFMRRGGSLKLFVIWGSFAI